MNEAGVAPPGLKPIQNPMKQLRRKVRQYRGRVRHVSQTTRGLIFAEAPLKDRPSSMVSRISPMPKRPITATMKSNPFMRSVKPKVIRSVPVTMSSPTAARMKPIRIDTSDLSALPPPSPTKDEKVRSWMAKNSGGPNLSATSARRGAKSVIRTTANSAPTKDDGKAAERGGHRPGLARDVEQDGRDGAPEERAPVEAREQDDGRRRRHGEGQRQQDGDPVGAAEARQHADDGAERDADDGEKEVVRLKRDLEAEEEVLETHGSVTEVRFQRALRHGHEEPDLEDVEGRRRYSHAHHDHGQPRVPPDPAHVGGRVQRGGDVEAEPGRGEDEGRGRQQHLENGLNGPRPDEGRAVGAAEGLRRDHQAGPDHDDAEPERKKAALGTVGAPADTEAQRIPDHEHAARDQHECRRKIRRAHAGSTSSGG